MAASAFNRLGGNASGGCAGPRMTPGNATTSLVFQKIAGTHTCGGSRMPLNRTPLSTMQQNLIRDWINQGAQDN